MEYYNVENCTLWSCVLLSTSEIWDGSDSCLLVTASTSKCCPFLNICRYWSPLWLVNVSSDLTSKKTVIFLTAQLSPSRNIQRITVLSHKKSNKELKTHIRNGFVETKESFIKVKSIDCNSGRVGGIESEAGIWYILCIPVPSRILFSSTHLWRVITLLQSYIISIRALFWKSFIPHWNKLIPGWFLIDKITYRYQIPETLWKEFVLNAMKMFRK